MKVCILAGGLGTRLSEETVIKPKPMVEIGPWPILRHIMHIYAAFGHKEFVIALGYKGGIIKDYFLDFRARDQNLSVNLATGEVTVHGGQYIDWNVHLVDTGRITATGGRIKRLQPWVGEETFMATYGDGVADVNLDDLLAFHRAHGKLATVTAVRPPSRFGDLVLDGARVTAFNEKPQAAGGWINGGFFVFEPAVFDYIAGDSMPLEDDPLGNLAAEGQLIAYRHEGFWQPMDTLRERLLLENLWESGAAPWKVWDNDITVE